MNERTKQLWKESQQWNGSDDGRGGLKILESVEKFAKLIGRECLTLADSIRDGLDEDGEKQQALGAAWVGLAIERHFMIDSNERKYMTTDPEPEAKYDPVWCIEYCKSYAEQLRDKTRANRAEHAAECIEYLLGLVDRKWVSLTAEEIAEISEFHRYCHEAAEALRAALAQPEREWVGLTGYEVNECAAGCHNGNSVQDAIRKAEAKLKDKNT